MPKRKQPSLGLCGSIVLFGVAAAAFAPARGAAPVGDAGEVRLRPPRGARFEFRGVLGQRIDANLRQWLLTAPEANPGMTEMLRVRDRVPVPELVPWAGEFVGKYLLSAIQACRMVHSKELEETIRRVVDEVIAAQDDGYFGPFTRKERLLGHWDLWGHYHVMQSLLVYHDETGYEPALEAAGRAGDLICRTYLDTGRRVFDAGSHEMNMAVIHGLGLLYRRTGHDRYLRMMRHIEEDWQRAGDYFRTGLAGVDFYRTPRPRWESLHDLQGLTELFRITGEPEYRTALLNHWQSIRELDRHNTGAFSTSERAVGSPYHRGSIETCCTVAWMAMTIDALMLTGDSTAADELEWSLLNAMLGAQHPSGRWWTYDTPMDGVRKASAHDIVFQARAGTPELNCCSVNGPRSLAMLTDWAVMVDDEGLVINYYGPMRVSAADGSGDLVQETRYPADGRVRITINPRPARRIVVKLRVPAWSRTTTVRVNDEPPAQAPPGRYFVLDREWSSGDTIALAFDMSPRYWTGEAEVAGCASIFRGPLLLAFDQHYNTLDTPQIPTIDLASLRLRDVSADDRFPPIVLCELPTADGENIRLCDFASAGAHGTHYRSWLPARGGRPADFFLRRPRSDEATPGGPLLFEWVSHASPDPHAPTFDLVVARDERFEQPVLERKGLRHGHYLHREGLEPGGAYWWKVTARNAAGAVENADGPRRFTIDPARANSVNLDCFVLADGPDALAIAAPLDGTATPQRGCLSSAADVKPAPDRNGRPNGALRFNGKSSKVLFAVPEFPQEAYTVSAWIRVEAFATKTYQQVFSAWAAGLDDPLRLSVMGDGLCARIEMGQVFSTPAVKLERGVWTHAAAVKDGETLALYVNGQQRATGPAPKRVLSGATMVALGANPSFSGDEYFDGCIDEFAFHARALSADEIRKAYEASRPAASAPAVGAPFFDRCAFVCIDIQPGERRHLTEEQLPKAWKQMGFTAEDVNAATDYAFDVAYPNARKVADACRRLRLPMIFVHWGCRFEDGMDLDPEIRRAFLAEHGADYAKWGHRLSDPGSRPAELLGVRDGEYVIPKSGQDAFTSSSLGAVLANLGVKNIVFVGGHTGACLGKTAASAKRLGYRTLCVEDATFDARQSTRLQRIRETGFDHVISTAEFVAMAAARATP